MMVQPDSELFKPVLGVFTSGTMSASPRLVLYTNANLRASLEGIYSPLDHSRIEHVFCYPQAFSHLRFNFRLFVVRFVRCGIATLQTEILARFA